MAKNATATATNTATASKSNASKSASAKASRKLLREAKDMLTTVYDALVEYLADGNEQNGDATQLADLLGDQIAAGFTELATKIEAQATRNLKPEFKLAALQDQIAEHQQKAIDGGIEVMKTTEWQDRLNELVGQKIAAEKAIARAKRKAAKA